MAELAQINYESFKEEIAEMARIKLFTPEQLRFILITRKDFENKIVSVSKTVEDFRSYIVHEKALLKQIQNHRDKNLINDRKSAIEYKIMMRIKQLYEKALQRFSDDFSLCLEYFEFCKKANFIAALPGVVDRMQKNYPYLPEMWQTAAAWYAHEKNDYKTALSVLNKGLTFHKNNELLYTEAIKLELNSVANVDGYDDNRAISKTCKEIRAYIECISDCINGSDIFIKLLHLLDSYSFTESIQNEVIEQLLDNYSHQATVWHTLAERKQRTSINACFEMYKKGLSQVDRKDILWSHYIDCLIECDDELITKNDKNKILKDVFKEASFEGCLAEKYYIKWLEHATDEEAVKILKEGTQKIPGSVVLWKLQLQYATTTQFNKDVDIIFEDGITVLKEKSLPLWIIYIRYYNLLVRIKKVEAIYERGIKEHVEISTDLKPKFIEWIAMTKGVDEARTTYKKIALGRPYCKELHTVMLKFEACEIEPDYNHWGAAHALSCEQFGEEHIDVWINHIYFYLFYNTCDDSLRKVQAIKLQAENTLRSFLKYGFQEEYEKLCANS